MLMPRAPLIAQVRLVPDGAVWRMSVGDGEGPPVEATLPAPQLALSLPTPKVLRAGSDASLAAEEDRVAAAMAAQLAGAGTAWAHLQVLRGRAEASGQGLVVALDAPDEAPWELWSLGRGPLETSGAGTVVRWAAGAAASERTVSARAAVWDASDDDASRSVVGAARAAMADAGLTLVDLDGHPSVLWVVAHGECGAEALELAMGPGGAGVHAMSAALHEALEHASLVVLAVCHGAAEGARGTPALVEPMLAAGVPLVVAPGGPVPTEVLAHFASGLGTALGAGAALAESVVAGRRAVRKWAFPHPLARWWGLRSYVGQLSVLSAVVVPRAWRPDEWPHAAPDAAAWLNAAHHDATRRTDGYVGVEHLLRTVTEVSGGAAHAATLRRCAGLWLRPYEEVSAGLLPQPGHERAVDATPRLHCLGRGLADSFDVEALAAAVLAQPVLGPRGLTEASLTDGLHTLETVAPAPGAPADALELVGGPEDGRVVPLSEGLVIGRAGGSAAVQLYRGTWLTDRALSRSHVTWSQGALQSRRSVRVEGPEGARAAHEPLRHGDVVVLTAATRLRAVARG